MSEKGTGRGEVISRDELERIREEIDDKIGKLQSDPEGNAEQIRELQKQSAQITDQLTKEYWGFDPEEALEILRGARRTVEESKKNDGEDE